jgi:hypothetical protein
LNVRSLSSLDKTLWRSRIFGFRPHNPDVTRRKSLGGKALAKRKKSQHRSDATKWNRFVRSYRCAVQESARELKTALDQMRLHFVPFSRFSRKNHKELTTEGTEVTEKTTADGGEFGWMLDAGCKANEPPRSPRVRSVMIG